MRCPHCSSDIPDDSKFCPICGATLAKQEEETEKPDADVTSQVATPAGAQVPVSDNQSQAPQARKAPVALVVVIAIVILAATAFVAVFLYANVFNKPQQAQEAPATQPATTEETAQTEAQTEEDAAAAKAAARQQAIDDAQAAGKTVLSGTIRIFSNDDELVSFQGIRNPNPGTNNGPYAILALDSETTITTEHIGDGGNQSTNDATMIRLAYGSEAGAWASYDGQHVDCVLESMYWPSDTSLPLGEPHADSAQIFDDSGNLVSPGASSSSASASSDDSSDYILPDSSSRVYSASELQGYSKHDLTLARNEIFARHGRGFKDAQIRQYFESKSWYHQTYTADEFDALSPSPLSSVEQKNVATILDVENSK